MTIAYNPRCLLTVLEDGNGVLLHLDTKFYFTLNSTGVFVWQCLEKKPLIAQSDLQLASQLAQEFEVDLDTATADVRALVSELLEESLVLSA